MPVVAAVAVGIFGAATAVTAAFTTIGAITVFGVSLATIATVGLAVSTLVAAVTMASAFKKPASQEQGTVLQVKLDPHAPVPVVYGRTATAGFTTFKKTSGTKNAFLSAVAVLSVGPIAEIESAKFDDLALTFSGSPASSFATVVNTAPADASSKTFKNGRLKVHWSVGPTSGTALPTRLGWTPPGMSSATKGNGLAHAVTRFEFDQEAFPGGEPRKQIYTIKGRPLYDPRLDSTYPGGDGPQRRSDPSTWAFSENPYLAALDWTLGYWVAGRRVYGIGAPWGQVDVQAFVEGANVADLNEWKVGGQVVSDDDKFAVLTSILQSGGGLPIAQAGRISVMVNAPKASVMTITDADIIGEIETTGIAAFRERINTIVPQYRAESQNWETIPGEEISVETYVEEDQGERRSHEVVFGMVQDAAQAHQLAAYELVNSREALTVKLTGRPRLMNVRVGEAITLTHGDLITAQKMVVMAREIDPATLTVSLELRAETDAKHAFALGQSQEAPPSPEVNGLDPSVPDAPGETAWTVAATALNNASGVSLPAIILVGAVDDPNAVGVIVEIKREGGDWTEYTVANRAAQRIEITGLTDGDAYEVGLSHRTVRGYQSERRVIGPVTVGQTISGGVRPGGIDWTSNVIANVPGALTVDGLGRLNANAVGHLGSTLATLLDGFDADLSAATDGTTGLVAQATVLRDQAASNAAQALANAIAAAEASGWAQGNAVASQTSAGHAASNATVATLQAGYATANASLALDRATLAATYRDQAQANATIATTQATYAAANASIAQSNATLSATFAGYAQANSTVAQQQAGYATSNAALASDQRALAATFAGYASANATVAQTQAGYATSNAALASASSTLSATYRNDARSLAARTLPSTFENGGEFFSYGITGSPSATAGSPTTYYGGSHTWTFPTPYDGRSILRQSTFGSGAYYAHIRNRGVMPATRGRTFRGRAEARNLSGYANTNFYAGMYGLTADFSTLIYLTSDYVENTSFPATSGYGVANLTGDWTQIGWQVTVRADAPSDLAWIVFAPYTFNSGGAQGDIDWSLVEFADVTESVRAASNATISAQQAGYATANAAIAQANAVLAATFSGYAQANAALTDTLRTYAAANATIASTQAGYASANAALASASSTLAASYRDGAIQASRNFGFEHGLTGWTQTGSATVVASLGGRPNVLSLPSGAYTDVRGTIKIPFDPARQYRVRGRYWTGTGSGSSQIYMGFAAYDATGAELAHDPGSYAYVAALGVMQPAGAGWVEYVSDVIVPQVSALTYGYPPGTAFIAPLALMNYNFAEVPTGLDEIVIEDVTESERASANATIAAQQAAYATANAAIAQANAVLAATFSGYAQANAALTDTLRSYAAANATIATTQAGYATSNAALASESSVLSATYASNAALATAYAFPETIDGGWLTTSGTGPPSAVASAPNGQGTISGGVWTSPVGNGEFNGIAVALSKALIPWASGRVYEVECEVEAVSGSGGTAPVMAFPYAIPLTSAFTAFGNEFYQGTVLTVGSRTVLRTRFGMGVTPSGGVQMTATGNEAFVRFGALFNFGNGNNRQTRLYRLSIRDVTALAAAEAQAGHATSNATISTTQAGYATANAAAALSSSTLSATYSGYALANATAADTARSYAQANATIATTQAATATASAATAALYQSISAGLATGHLNPNSAFQDWTSPTACAGWFDWEASGGTNSRVTGIEGRAYALRSASSGSGYFGFYNGGGVPALPPGGAWVVAEADVTLVAGDIRGSGVHIWAPGAGSWNLIDFGVEVGGGGVVGRTYRFRKLFDLRHASIELAYLFGMTRYDGGFATVGSVTLDWHRLGFRIATQQEIDTQTVLPGLTANVTTMQETVTDLDAQFALARWEVAAAASGGLPTRIRLTSSTYGSSIALEASEIFFGDNTVFDDATDTLRTTTGSSIRVIAFGAAFGTDGTLTEWEGPSSVAFASMSRANAYFYRANTSPYLGGSAIPGGQTAGGKEITGSAGSTAATATASSVSAGSLIEMSATFSPVYIDDDSTMSGEIIFEESNNGGSSWTTLTTVPVVIGSTGLGYGPGQWGADSAGASFDGFGSLSGNMTYRIRFNRTGGANLYGGSYRIDGTLKVSPPLA